MDTLKLLNRGVPVLLIQILLYWYRTQMFCIKWDSTTSNFFNLSNGVQQGGILPPYLFTAYIDDLSNMLNSAGIGCHIHNCCTNPMFYADDLCVIAKSQWSSGFAEYLCKVWFLKQGHLFKT